MSIFLLISIGSVCAEDNSTADADILSDDGSDIILSDESSESKNITSVESENTKVKTGETAILPVTVKDKDSNKINVTKSEISVSEGSKTVKSTYNNSQITITDNLKVGNHSLIIKYKGNNNYLASNTTVILSIFENYTIQLPSSFDINSSTKTAEIPINVTNGVDKKTESTDEISAVISYKEGNVTKNITVSDLKHKDGKLTFAYNLADNITSSTLIVTYNDNETKTSKNTTLNRIFNVKIEALNLVNQYQDGEFTFKVTDVDTNEVVVGKQVVLTTVGNIRAGFTVTTNESGIASFKTANLYEFNSEGGNISQLEMKKLDVGKHQVDITTSGNIKSEKLTTNLTISKAKIKIEIKDFKEDPGTNKNVTIAVTNTKSGNPVAGIVLKVELPQTVGKTYYIQTDSEGNAKISVKNLTGGVYNITASNNDTKNIVKASDSGTFIINPSKVVISTKSVTIRYNTGTTATIKVTDKKTGKVVPNAFLLVRLYTGSKSANYVFLTNDKGVVKFSAPLAVGKHKMVVSTADNRYDGGEVTKYITVKKSTGKLSAPKVTSYYKEGKNFTVKLVNTKKNNSPIYGANVNIRVFVSNTQYYNYNGQTGADGKLQLKIDLTPGTYKVEVLNGDGKNYTAKKITSKIVVKKTKAKITPKKLTSKKGVSKKFKVKVINKKTKTAVIGVKVKIKVYTGKNYKIYTKKTNSNGYAKLNVKSLKVGKHKVYVSSGDKYCTAKKAKSTIKITK